MLIQAGERRGLMERDVSYSNSPPRISWPRRLDGSITETFGQPQDYLVLTRVSLSQIPTRLTLGHGV